MTTRRLMLPLMSLVFFVGLTPATQAALVGHYTFDDANNLFADSSVLGNHGSILSGDPTQSATAVAGAGAADFDGNDAGEIDAIADNVPPTVHSLSAWINTTYTGSGKLMFLSANNVGGQNGLLMSVGASTVQIHLRTGGYQTTGAAVSNGAYHHVVWTRDGNSAITYVDGVQVDTTTINPAGTPNYTLAATDQWSIGQEWDAPNAANPNGRVTNIWQGLVDDVQIYDTALSADDVDFLFNNPGIAVGAIPEPSTCVLLLMGLLGLTGLARRRGRGEG